MRKKIMSLGIKLTVHGRAGLVKAGPTVLFGVPKEWYRPGQIKTCRRRPGPTWNAITARRVTNTMRLGDKRNKGFSLSETKRPRAPEISFDGTAATGVRTRRRRASPYRRWACARP